MEREQYLAAIKPRMPKKRYIHTIGVMETAIDLAQKYGEDVKKLKQQLSSTILLNMQTLSGWRRSFVMKN